MIFLHAKRITVYPIIHNSWTRILDRIGNDEIWRGNKNPLATDMLWLAYK